MSSPLFLIGVQRSGTTLLRLMLNRHSQLAIPQEATFLMPLLDKKYLQCPLSGNKLKNIVKYLELNSHFELWDYDNSRFLQELSNCEQITLRDFIDSLFQSYAQAEKKKVWGDKTPSFFRKLDILLKLFPDAKFVHIVRDGRDVYSSWQNMDYLKGNHISVIAAEWAYKLAKIERSMRKISTKNKLTIRYEDLLSAPQEALQQICALINLDYEPGMLEFYKTSRDYVGNHHSRLIFKPIDASNCFKWKKSLPTQDVAIFNLFAKNYLEKYNYELTKQNIKFINLIKCAGCFIFGVFRRILQILRIKMIFKKAAQKGQAIHSVPVGKLPTKNQTLD